MKHLRDPRFRDVVACFETCLAYARAHDDLAAVALKTYGNHGAQISGCVRDHFPQVIKDALRWQARAVTYHNERAYEARPARVRHETIRAIGRAIAKRDGCGFYGPQA
jgi:hypothetical protein